MAVDRRELKLLETLVFFIEAKNVLELGVYQGDASVGLCKAVDLNGGKFIGMDNWKRHGLKNQYGVLGSMEGTEAKLKEAGCKNYQLIKIDTLKDREHFKNELKTLFPEGIDLAFIDADHTYYGVANDFYAVYPNLSEGAVVVFHDTLAIDGCREFVLDLRSKYNDGTFDIVDFPYGQGSRHCGVTLLVKRSYSTYNKPIDEICGSKTTPAEIEGRELEWYNKEKENRPVMPTQNNNTMLVDNWGLKKRNKYE